jgi:hypothetical protein
MPRPFLVLASPRSRSTWLAHFLNGGHDLAVEATSLDDLVSAIRAAGGSVETGGMLGWRVLKRAMPEATVVVLRRPPGEVIGSFAKLGIQIDQNEMWRRDGLLAEAAGSSGVHQIWASDLSSEATCKWVYERCVGEPFDRRRWLALAELNIQTQMTERLALLNSQSARIVAFKQAIEAAEAALRAEAVPTDGLVVTWEPWASFWPDARSMAEGHFAEVDAGDDPSRRFQLDERLMSRMASTGSLRVMSARRSGRLVGYLTWTIQLDPECLGMLEALQGGWYASPDEAVGGRLLARSLAELEALGVQHVSLHNRVNGRGADMARHFERLGAKLTQHTYSLALGAKRDG